MFRKQKEKQRLLEVSRHDLEEAQDRVEKLAEREKKLEGLVKNISAVLYREGQGTIVDRYDKIKMLVDDYQSNN